MKARKILFSDIQGHPIRWLHTPLSEVAVVRHRRTRRIEFIDPQLDNHEDFELLQQILLTNLSSTCKITNVGSLTESTSASVLELDPQWTEKTATPFPVVFKWSSMGHGFIVSLLLLFYFIFPEAPMKKSEAPQLVTIDLQKFKKNAMADSVPAIKNPAPTDKKTPPSASVPPKSSSHPVRVVPRTDQSKPLLQKIGSTAIHPKALSRVSEKSVRNFNISSHSSTHGTSSSFQRLGTLGAVANAMKGSRHGFGSGLRSASGGTGGGWGRGAGIGKGHGTSGHGHDTGGGYQQALYGKGLIAGQVGSGSGGYGSGWGNGTPGAGSYGKNGHGTGGGHVGYGTSKFGSGASTFNYPISEEAVVEGGLDRDQVQLVISRNLGQIAYCYELGLQKENRLKGRVTVDFVINSKGSVKTIDLASSSLHAPTVEKCIENKIKNWKFPKPVGGVEVSVNYPFLLQRVSQN